MPNDPELYLTLSEVESLIADAKERQQGKANQAILKEDLREGYAALASKKVLEDLLYCCQLRAGQFSPDARKLRAPLEELRRSGLQLIGKRIRGKAGGR